MDPKKVRMQLELNPNNKGEEARIEAQALVRGWAFKAIGGEVVIPDDVQLPEDAEFAIHEACDEEYTRLCVMVITKRNEESYLVEITEDSRAIDRQIDGEWVSLMISPRVTRFHARSHEDALRIAHKVVRIGRAEDEIVWTERDTMHDVND